MSFGSTLTITVNAVAKVLNRTGYPSASSAAYALYGTTDQYEAFIRHSKITREGVKYDRHNVEVIHTIYATSTAAEVVRRAYFVFENGKSDDKSALGYFTGGVVDYLDSATVQSDLATNQI